MIPKLFRVFKEKLIKLVTNAEYIDGVEIIAMLVTVHMMLSHRITSAAFASSAEAENLSTRNIIDKKSEPSEGAYDYMEDVLLECKKVLSDRLGDFLAAQFAWFREKKMDQKKTGVFSPVSRFPAFVDQIMAFAGSKVNMSCFCVPSLCLVLVFCALSFAMLHLNVSLSRSLALEFRFY